jgi:hypothetical protein
VTFNSTLLDSSIYQYKDSTFNLQPNEEKTLIVRSLLASGVFDPEGGTDTIWVISKLDIYENDTIPAKDSLRCAIYWNYQYKSRRHAELNLDLMDKYFH